MYNFAGKNILVTGASSGIGKQVAIDLACEKASVFICGRNNSALLSAFPLLKGENHRIFCGELTNEAHILNLAENLPVLNGMVYCAGVTKSKPVKFLSKNDISDIFDINFNSAVLLTSALLKNKKIAKGSSLVFISSIATKHPYRGGSLYSGSKAALEAFSKTLALELSGYKIRVNCISPSLVRTPMFEETEKNISSEEMQKLERLHPLGFGTPGDVAAAALFLISDKSQWVTGSNIVLGGI